MQFSENGQLSKILVGHTVYPVVCSVHILNFKKCARQTAEWNATPCTSETYTLPMNVLCNQIFTCININLTFCSVRTVIHLSCNKRLLFIVKILNYTKTHLNYVNYKKICCYHFSLCNLYLSKSYYIT